MLLERERYLSARPYERTEERIDYANGFKPKTVQSRIGELEFSVPQTRQSGFYPNSLEKGLRSERALKAAVAEMYLSGVSTRKVAKITKDLCGFDISSTQVSRATAELDEMIEAWRNRPLTEGFPYILLDAQYQKVRYQNVVQDCAVLIATGVTESGTRTILGVSVALSEQEVHWRMFLESLQKRGLKGLKLITSDAHSGLKAALRAVFPSVPWQRCQFHLQQNAQSYIAKKDDKQKVAVKIRAINQAESLEDAKEKLRKFVEENEKTSPKLAEWAEKNLPEGFAVFSLPQNHWVKMRTSNMLERLNQEVRRRTNVVRIFPNEKACVRLIAAILMEKAEQWETGKKYLNLEE
jgi:transposase-like protein